MGGNKSQFCSVGTDSNFFPISFHHPVKISFNFLLMSRSRRHPFFHSVFFFQFHCLWNKTVLLERRVFLEVSAVTFVCAVLISTIIAVKQG